MASIKGEDGKTYDVENVFRASDGVVVSFKSNGKHYVLHRTKNTEEWGQKLFDVGIRLVVLPIAIWKSVEFIAKNVRDFTPGYYSLTTGNRLGSGPYTIKTANQGDSCTIPLDGKPTVYDIEFNSSGEILYFVFNNDAYHLISKKFVDFIVDKDIQNLVVTEGYYHVADDSLQTAVLKGRAKLI